MNKPVLVILAAGLGSRYGGLKQMESVDNEGHRLIDFSVYDAVRAGFGKVIYIIKQEHLEDFKECIGEPASRHIEVEYAFQDMNDVPEGFVIPQGRTKPWGTAHALYSCKDKLDAPFAIINADDYYGVSAYKTIYDFLVNQSDDDKMQCAMVGYVLGNTLTLNGSVARGCCITDNDGYLTEIVERTHIVSTDSGAAYSEDGGNTLVDISPDSLVSMNMWGFGPSIMQAIEEGLTDFFAKEVAGNPLKSECFIPVEVDKMIKKESLAVKVLSSRDKWFGVTYKEDLDNVVKSIAELKAKGIYPQKLW